MVNNSKIESFVFCLQVYSLLIIENGLRVEINNSLSQQKSLIL